MGKIKIPCGGFVLNDSLTLDEENRLGVNWEKQTQSDWNQNDETVADYIKNRPFYTTDPVDTVLIEEQTVKVQDGSVELSGSVFLQEGETYTVNFNGTLYECVAWYSENEQCVMIGNGSIYGDDTKDSGEPFACDNYDDGHIYLNTGTDGTYTISISGNVTQNIKIDSKYLPNSNVANGSSKGSIRAVLSKKEDEDYQLGYGAFACGRGTIASGDFSHVEGIGNLAIGEGSHAEGDYSTASGQTSHVEGGSCTASGYVAHAEGLGTIASGQSSHAEGHDTRANGEGSHAEGRGSKASGDNSHAEGFLSQATKTGSHSEGYYTVADSEYQHVQGKCNIKDAEGKYAHIVGNGTSNTARSNAHTIDWSGNAWFAGNIEGTALIIPSSTSGSTKKFKITVDDSGTISATEVV